MEKENRNTDNGVREEKGDTRGAGAGASGSNSTGTSGSGAGAGSGAGSGAGASKEKELSQVAPVKTDKQPKVVEIKAPEVKEKKTRKRAPAKKAEPKNNELAIQLTALISGVSGVVATRPHMEHWVISEKEAQTIAEPLSKVIEKSEALSKVSEHSDSIALAIACVTVIAPRAMISMTYAQENKKLKKKGVKQDVTKTGENKRDSGENARAITETGADASNSLFDALQPTFI